MLFISFSCSTEQARTSSTMLNSSCENAHPCLVPPNLWGKSFKLLPLSIMLAVGFFVDALYKDCNSSLLRIFIVKECWILSYAFSVSIDMVMYFFKFRILNQPFNLRIIHTISQCCIIFIYCWIWCPLIFEDFYVHVHKRYWS